MEITSDSRTKRRESRNGSERMAAALQQGGEVPQVEAVSSLDLEKLIESQDYRCALSGVPLTPDSASLDHKVPVVSGGTHSLDNLQWVSPAVNKAKGTMTNDEFLKLCRLVVLYSESCGE